MLKIEPCRENAAPPPSGRPAPDATPLRILCADDDSVARQFMHALLTRNGHVVTCASDGLEAWVEISTRPEFYDMVITDHDMPRANGLALVSQLRVIGYPGRIVVISGSIDQSLANRYRSLAVDAILAKPFLLQELLGIVQSRRNR